MTTLKVFLIFLLLLLTIIPVLHCTESLLQISQFIEDKIASNRVMLFTKSYCPYSIKARRLLKRLKIRFEFIDLDRLDMGIEIHQELRKRTGGHATVPSVWVNGRFIGGCNELARHLLQDEEKTNVV